MRMYSYQNGTPSQHNHEDICQFKYRLFQIVYPIVWCQRVYPIAGGYGVKESTQLLVAMVSKSLPNCWWLWCQRVYPIAGGYGVKESTQLLVAMVSKSLLNCWWLWCQRVYPIPHNYNMQCNNVTIVNPY